ncbi:MAG: FtsW/RodA/SpoVE family cell cycle protein, partial [Candidatus Thiodiazotropha sp. (ex Cardiolucina cf. quadrata)]|nr:FtsW/RodA/SpoVE family cell cycle protein [Candidatus Thiodiazotropha sp. (ex Cardiolucina cf. quadrata)]
MRAKAHLTFHESQPAQASGLLAWLHIDLPLLTGLVLLSGVGLLILYSAGDREMVLLQKQLFRLGFGFVAMFALAQIHPANIRRWSPLLYSVGIVMLLSVILFGESGKGAQRWLDLG